MRHLGDRTNLFIIFDNEEFSSIIVVVDVV